VRDEAEYKASGAVGKSEAKKHEMAKDASAFANAEGGQIIYGMKEKNHYPDGLDAGIDPIQFPGIWFEQVIQQNVSPQIEGLNILEVPLEDGTGRVAVVVTVPPAQARAPHQAKDGRYYRRHNFGNQIMNDSEVRDTMRRTTTPELWVKLALPRGDNASVEFAYQSEISKPIILRAAIGNRSNQPALYTLLRLGIDTEIEVSGMNQLNFAGQRSDGANRPLNWWERRLAVPTDLPIFKEAELDVSQLSLSLTFHSRQIDAYKVTHFRVATLVQTPGYSAIENWTLRLEGGHLRLLEPGAAA
jgi:hypothetical protein